MSNERTIHIVCACGHPEHQFDLTYWDWGDGDLDMFLTIHLAKDRNILRRIRYAIRYVFGYQSKYGAFDEVVISPQMAKQISEFCMSFWIRHTSTMQFDSIKEIE
jgi:hypothetical protein